MTSSPHDALIKTSLSRIENAVGLFRSVLPTALVQQLDFSTLTLLPGSYIEPDLTDCESDLLFSIQCAGRPARVYTLLEHLSTPLHGVVFRLIRYMGNIALDYLKAHPKAQKVPAIVPVVLYHGEQAWSAPTSIQAWYDVDPATLASLAPYVPHFSFVLDDITFVSNEQLRRRPMPASAKLMLVMLRDLRSLHTAEELWAQCEEFWNEVMDNPSNFELVQSFLSYIYFVRGSDVLRDFCNAMVRSTSGTRRQVTMNLVEQYQQERYRLGMQEGILQGMFQGKLEGERVLLLKQVRVKFGPIPDWVRERLEQAPPAHVDEWAERILTASTLDEVFANTAP